MRAENKRGQSPVTARKMANPPEKINAPAQAASSGRPSPTHLCMSPPEIRFVFTPSDCPSRGRDSRTTSKNAATPSRKAPRDALT